MKYLSHFLLFTLITIGVQTTIHAQKPPNVKSYFFPYQQFFQPVVYKFVDQLNKQNIQYWWMQTQIINKDTILTTKTYDPKFNKVEVIQEKIETQGSILKKLTMLEEGKWRKTRVEQKQVYRWHQQTGQNLVWNVGYMSSYGLETFTKKRTLLGSASFKSLSEKSHQAIKFKDHFTRKVQKDSWSDSVTFYQYSIYCKNLGLLEYQRFYKGKMILHYKVEKIMDAQVWKRISKK
ncbi:MAG TPA: hypothetical protein DCS93_10310 [Microscillaceae bacterium]|nr:hypothetical protein [Microscillaceae bacterium]